MRRLLATCATTLIVVSCSNSENKASINILDQAGKNITKCETASNSQDTVTAEEIDACVNSLATLGYDCDSPPSLTIIEIETGQWALREGKAPLRLKKNYSFDDLMQLCK